MKEFQVITQFQFHKVRLKAVTFQSEQGFTLFQFHKVRLKGQDTLQSTKQT